MSELRGWDEAGKKTRTLRNMWGAILNESRQPFRATGGLTRSFFPLPKKPLFPSGRGTLPLPSQGCFGGFREVSGGPFSLKMAPRGPPMLQDGLQDGSRQPKMVQDSFRHASKRPQEGHKTVPRALGDPSGPLQEPQILQKPKEN